MSQIRRRQFGKKAESKYIEDGLIFHLDSNTATASTWTDLVSEIPYTMYNTSIAEDGGVVFNGSTSYCWASSRIIPVDKYSGTIELVANTYANGDYAAVGQPGSGGYIAFIMYKGASCVGVNGQVNMWNCNPTGLHTIALTNNYLYKDTVSASKKGTDSFGAQSPNGSFIGVRNGGNTSIGMPYKGTIYQIRAYNRILTAEEVLHNQNIDIKRYNINR